MFITPRLFPDDDDGCHDDDPDDINNPAPDDNDPPPKKRRRMVPAKSWPVDTLDVGDTSSDEDHTPAQKPGKGRKGKNTKGKPTQAEITSNMLESMQTMTTSISALAGAYQKVTSDISPNAKWGVVLVDKVDRMPKHMQEKFKNEVDNLAYQILSETYAEWRGLHTKLLV